MAHYANDNNLNLEQANEHFKFLSPDEFKKAMDPYKMAQGGRVES